jgi:hypothetical protein
MIRRCRRFIRSARTPAHTESSSTGANCSAVTVPTATPDSSDSTVSTSQSWATRCIQVPMLATRAPPNHRR